AEELEYARGRRPPRPRVRRRAELPARKLRHDEVERVRQSDGDEIAELHALLLEAARHAIAPLVQFAEGQRVFGDGERWCGWFLRREVREVAPDREELRRRGA